MNKTKRIYVQFTILLLVILLLGGCASTARKQVELWDVSGIHSIAIIPPTTIGQVDRFNKNTDIEKYYQVLRAYIGSEAKNIIQESGKFTLATDSKAADAILDCDIISVNRKRNDYRSRDGQYYENYEYIVLYNIFLKRTSDGTIIGDSAGMGRESATMASYKDLIHIDQLRQALGLPARKKEKASNFGDN